MDPATQAWVFALLGAFLGGGVVLAWRVSERPSRSSDSAEPAVSSVSSVPAGVATVLGVLRSSALVVDANDRVLKASAPAHALGLVHGESIAVAELADLIRLVRRDGQIRETELALRTTPKAQETHLTARVAPLSSRLVLALVEDRTRERRVEAIRKDFVANVSHELKTPAGAITLLAEAVQDARDDPEAVVRFAGRMRSESERLNRLVQQIIELSRLQGDDPMAEPAPVDVRAVVARAVESCSTDAASRGIEVEQQVRPDGLWVLGNADEIALALGNLVANAVAYSPEHSRVVVTAERADDEAGDGPGAGPGGGAGDDMVALSVSDQGIGIPAAEIDRIFERFYRVDPARHRATGGTGLGLSIVKHVAASHGGEVTVWSVQGRGSTFTLRLPASHAPAASGRRTSEEAGR